MFVWLSPWVFLGFTSVSEYLVYLKLSVSLSLCLHLWGPECLSICGFLVLNVLGSVSLGLYQSLSPGSPGPARLGIAPLAQGASGGGVCAARPAHSEARLG